MAAAAVLEPAAALTIDPVFGSSITAASNPFTASIESAIGSAIGTIDSLYSNPGTVNVVFNVCGGGNQAGCGGSFLAESNTSDYSYTYSQYTGELAVISAAHPANTVLATAIANLGTGNMPGPAGTVQVTAADAQIALGDNVSGCFTSTGTLTGCGTPYDGVVTLNIGAGGTLNYTTNPVSGEYSAVGGLEHELNEILGGGGQGTTLNNIPCAGSKTAFPDLGVLDLYRYSSPGVPSFSSCNGTSAYFSVDGGTTDIVMFNNNPGGDLADFGPNGYVQSAFANPGIVPAYTTSTPEFPMMESIGYDGATAAVPEPASLAVLGSGLAGMLAVRRRRARTHH
jgi:hypothetical protein